MARPRVANSKPKYRVAVIGCGKIGVFFESESRREKPASHAGAVMANKKTKLVALVDTDAKNLNAARKLFPGARGYRSIVECLKTERPDIVLIATPPSARLAPLKECARYRVPIVICEKPLAKTLAEGKKIESLVAKSGMTFVLNYHRRFSGLFARARGSIAKGRIGRVQQVTCYYSNGLCNNGGHTLDALSYLLHDDIVSVVAAENSENNTFPEGDMSVDALLKTKNGTMIVLQSFDQREYGIHDFRIYGTNGSIDITDYGTTLTETPVGQSRFSGIQQLDSRRGRTVHIPLSATEGALSHAIECHEKHRTPLSSARSGVAVLRILEAMVRSARSGGKKIPV
ncbi:MAG: Gfo/Idh/MocA family oxidoreductase [bacterium]|nr:Gfo/Idh/MocA family oxidoreductase [bacterium]